MAKRVVKSDIVCPVGSCRCETVNAIKENVFTDGILEPVSTRILLYCTKCGKHVGSFQVVI